MKRWLKWTMVVALLLITLFIILNILLHTPVFEREVDCQGACEVRGFRIGSCVEFVKLGTENEIIGNCANQDRCYCQNRVDFG